MSLLYFIRLGDQWFYLRLEFGPKRIPALRRRQAAKEVDDGDGLLQRYLQINLVHGVTHGSGGDTIGGLIWF